MRIRSSVIAAGISSISLLAVSPAWSACVNPPASPLVISQFKADPLGLAGLSNADTRSIEIATRDIAATDAALASDLVSLAEKVRPQFQTAIAAGLAQAAVACSTVDQAAAQQIQQAVAAFQNGTFQASFAAVAGDLSTAATAIAAAAAVSGFGSVVVTNPNTSTSTSSTSPQGTTPRRTTTGIFDVSGSGALSATATTAAGPVSPTQ